MANPAMAREANYVLTLEEIGNLTQEGGKPAETLMNVVALIARRFQTDVCSAYLLESARRPGCRISDHATNEISRRRPEGFRGPVAEQVQTYRGGGGGTAPITSGEFSRVGRRRHESFRCSTA